MSLSDINGRGRPLYLWRLDAPLCGDARVLREEWVSGWRNTHIEAKEREGEDRGSDGAFVEGEPGRGLLFEM